MEEFERHQDLPVLSDVVRFEGPAAEEPQGSPVEMLRPILRRWYIVLIIWVIVSAIGLTATYFVMGKKFDTYGSIRVSSQDTPIMYETKTQLPPYKMFKNTQAALIGGDISLNRAADDLRDRNLVFFTPAEDIRLTLRKMVLNKDVKIIPMPDNEFINIQMTTNYPGQAEALVNAIISGYLSSVDSEELKDADARYAALEKRKGVLENQIEQQQIKVRQRAEEYGTQELTSRQEIMLQTVSTIQQELIAISIRRIMLETQVDMRRKLLESDLTQDDLMAKKKEVVEQDPIVQSLKEDVNQYQELVREGQAMMQEGNPELQRRSEILADLERQLEKRRKEVAEQVEEEVQKEIIRSRETQLAGIEAELKQTIDYENRLREKMEKSDAETIGLGRKQFEIDDYQEELDQTKKIYQEVCRRIEELRIEQSRQPRVSLGTKAWSVEARGKQVKMAAVSIAGGLALGLFVAFIVGSLDKRMHVPQEMAKRIGVRIIGTTTCPQDVDQRLLPQQLLDDYQTIRANIGLMADAETTKMLVVTSPGMADGKTTFSINLATSFAQSGYKTLLIDADLRKPDVAGALKLPAGHRGFQDYLFGADIDKAVYKLESMDFYVLASDHRNTSDALTILSHPEMSKRIKKLRDMFDKVIIDTPPVLAFSDALVLARMSDGVVLTSYVGHTSKVEMREATDRLHEIDANILGTVVNNVKVSHSYRRYGYGYGYDYGRHSKDKQKERRKHAASTLLIAEETGDTTQG